MRELGFRVWDKEDEAYLHITKYLEDGVVGISPDGKKALYLEDGEVIILEDVIIEQDTGLKDKNGKEIYEGDIMRFDAIDYEICWSGDFSGWHNRRTDKGERVYGSNSFDEVTRFGSVIGNIHENKELLGEEE